MTDAAKIAHRANGKRLLRECDKIDALTNRDLAARRARQLSDMLVAWGPDADADRQAVAAEIEERLT